MKILLIGNEIRYTCGVTSHILSLISVFRTNNIDFEMICGGGNRVDDFRKNGITVHSYDFIKHQNRSVFDFFRSLFQVAIIIFKFKPNIIHTHHHYQSYIVRLISFLYSVPVLQSNHGLIPNVTMIPTFSGHYFTVLNQNIKDHLLDFGVKSSAIFLTGHGMDLGAEVEKDKNSIQVICASRFTKEKGLEDFIRAVSLLPLEIKSKADFEIAGEGETEQNLIELNNLTKANITISKSYTDLQSRLLETHIFVFPSHSKTEGLPITILEAGVAGNIVISSDYDGYDILLNHLDNSIIYRNGNITELTEWLENVILNYGKYQYCADKLKADVRHTHSKNVFSKSIIGIYNHIISDYN